MTGVMKPCAEPYCPELVPKGTDRCKLHRRSRRQDNRAAGRRTGSSSRWRKVRARALKRDGYRCQDCHRHISELGEDERMEVDHMDGKWTNNAMWNLRSRCSTCHHGKHREQQQQQRGRQ